MATTTTNVCAPSATTPTPHQTHPQFEDEVDELVSQWVPYAVDLGSEWKVEWKPCEVVYGTDHMSMWKPHVIALCDNPSDIEGCMWAKGSELTTQQRTPESIDLGRRWTVWWESYGVEYVIDGIYEYTTEWKPHVIAVCDAYNWGLSDELGTVEGGAGPSGLVHNSE